MPQARPEIVVLVSTPHKQRVRPASSPWLELCLEITNACQVRTQAVSRTASRGTDFINTHHDPTMEIDAALEELAVSILERRRVAATVLSEELIKAGKAPSLTPKRDPFVGGRKVYVCIDPLDGSKAYQRDFRAFWYSCVGIYDESGSALAGAVLDLNTRQVFYTDGLAAFQGFLQRNLQIRDDRLLRPSAAETLDGCYLETYVMGPRVYLPVAFRLEPLMRRCKFVIPNGGPASFCDVAAGVVDTYVELADFPMTEVFSGGLMVADAAGCITTGLGGHPVSFDPDPAKGYSLVCAATGPLHAETLRALGSI